MLFLGWITEIAKNSPKNKQSRPGSREQGRFQGRMEVTQVFNDRHSAIEGKILPFEMKNRVLPVNLRKGVYVRVRGNIAELTKKKKIIVVEEILIEPPEAIKRVYEREGIDVWELRNKLADKEAISLAEAFRNGYAAQIKKHLYTQEVAALQELLEKGNISCDVEVPYKIVDFFAGRAAARGYGTVSGMIDANPWVLGEMEEFRLPEIKRLAVALQANVRGDVEIYAHLTRAVWRSTRQGNSYAPLGLLALRMRQILAEHGIPRNEHRKYIISLARSKTDELPHKSMSKLVPFSQYAEEAQKYYQDAYGAEEIARAEIKARDTARGIYLVRAYYSERNAAEMFARFAGPHSLGIALSAIKAEGLDEDQEKAIANALANRVSVVNGHAGAGKTYAMGKLVQILRRHGYKTIVLAPSALAAAVAAAKTGLPVDYATIHRISKILPEESDYGEDGPGRPGAGVISEDVVIVDEMSMCDICTFSHLLFALAGNPRAHLVLVGDTAQLPAIGPAGFFHQLVRSGEKELGIPVVKLRGQYRHTDEISVLANLVRKGRFPEDPGDFQRVKTGRARDVQLVAEKLREEGFRAQDILFLSPVTWGESGTRKLNQILRAVFNPAGERINSLLHAGDPVIAIKNDYADRVSRRGGYWARHRHPGRSGVDVFNGMRGAIRGYNPDTGTITVEYTTPGNKFTVPYTVQEITHWVDAAYAVTVHKAQGGEAGCVVLVNDRNFLTRNMLYTALTRARERIYLLGKGWAEAVQNPAPEPLSKFLFRAEDALRNRVPARTENNGADQEGQEEKVLFG
ncbi:MAG: AAA family ATPase [Bacillota bacterium]